MSKTIKDGNFIGGEDLKSFLMIGQSNMAGRGEFADVPPIDNFRCYMLRNGRFLRMSEPVNPDRPIFGIKFHSGTSLAASFANELANEEECRVGLIPCADGGTYIDEWQPGEVLYEHAVFMTKLAMRRFELKKGERYVVAEDVVTKGGRVQETIDLVKAAGAKVAGVVLLVDRSGGKVKFGRIPMFSLMQMTPVTWEPSECPLCKAGGKPCHPGS